MKEHVFDDMTKRLVKGTSRRCVIRALAGTTVACLLTKVGPSRDRLSGSRAAAQADDDVGSSEAADDTIVGIVYGPNGDELFRVSFASSDNDGMQKLLGEQEALGNSVKFVRGPSTAASMELGAHDCGEHAQVEFDVAGNPVRIYSCAEGNCPAPDLCKIDSRHTPHGGKREWCDCNQDKKEPERPCRVVVIRLGAGEGGPKKMLKCAGADCSVAGESCLGEPEKVHKVAILDNKHEVWRVRCCKPT